MVWEIKRARDKAHKAFDLLWKKGYMSRRWAYIWLARKMRMRGDMCHISNFDKEQCANVIDIATKELEAIDLIREELGDV